MTIFGMLRVKNEARWIERVVRSILPICERIFILDDHSEDATDEFCERIDEKVTVYRSTFEGIDETRDKNFLLGRILTCVSDVRLRGDASSPYWVLAIDGDEVLTQTGLTTLRQILPTARAHAFKMPVWYLWDNEKQIRVDGVYRTFARPSVFRLMNREFTFQSTPWGGNFHCSSIPQQLLHHAHESCNAPLLHLGYMHRQDRLRKFEWYNRIDPHNQAEDEYRHMVVGDLFPASAAFRHGGPLQLANI